MRLSFCQSITLLIMILWVSSATAQTLTLAWDPSTDSAVAGYQLYYQVESPRPPFDGSEAAQGFSPIDVGPYNSQDIDLPDDGRVYYFAVTAYTNLGYESAFSNIIANFPRPVLLGPSQNSPEAGPTVTFNWSHEAIDPDTTYTLIYGSEAGVLASGWWGSVKADSGWWMIVFWSLVLWTLFRSRSNRIAWLQVMMAAGLFAVCLLSACGGGGGDGSGSNEAIPGIETLVVSGIANQYYETADLLPGQTYYWKILAVDSQGREVESDLASFRTLTDF
jgi:hypothetical protein